MRWQTRAGVLECQPSLPPRSGGRWVGRPGRGTLLILILMPHARSNAPPSAPAGAGALAPSLALALRAAAPCKSAVLPICPPALRGKRLQWSRRARMPAVPSPAQRGKVGRQTRKGDAFDLDLDASRKIKRSPFSPCRGRCTRAIPGARPPGGCAVQIGSPADLSPAVRLSGRSLMSAVPAQRGAKPSPDRRPPLRKTRCGVTQSQQPSPPMTVCACEAAMPWVSPLPLAT